MVGHIICTQLFISSPPLQSFSVDKVHFLIPLTLDLITKHDLASRRWVMCHRLYLSRSFRGAIRFHQPPCSCSSPEQHSWGCLLPHSGSWDESMWSRPTVQNEKSMELPTVCPHPGAELQKHTPNRPAAGSKYLSLQDYPN